MIFIRRHLVYASCLLFVLSVTSLPVAFAQESADGAGGTSIRLEKPYTVSYHSHWFLIGGVRLAKRIRDGLTEVNAFAGQSVITGCGIQAPKCEQGIAINAGARRYFFDTPFTIYAGANMHYIHDGIRGTDGPTGLLDLSLGINHQTAGHFNWGLGYSFFALDDGDDAFEPVVRGWILSELGYSF